MGLTPPSGDNLFTKIYVMEIPINLNPIRVRNVIGVYDSDELNAACDCMESEMLELKVGRVLNEFVQDGDLFDTEPLFSELKEKFGFEYCESDKTSMCWILTNGRYDLYLYPKWWYPQPGEQFILNNFHIITSDYRKYN